MSTNHHRIQQQSSGNVQDEYPNTSLHDLSRTRVCKAEKGVEINIYKISKDSSTIL